MKKKDNQYSYIEILEYIISLGYTKKEIADRSGVTPTAIYRYTLMDAEPKFQTIKNMCCNFNVPIKLILKFFYNIKVFDMDELLIDRKSLLNQIDIKYLIKQIKEKGYRYDEIADTIGISNNTLRRYLKEEVSPPSSLFRVLCEEYNIKPKLKRDKYSLTEYNSYLETVDNLTKLQKRY